jgi:hypothetical protein
MRKVLLAFISFLIISCATTYQSNSLTGGYSEMRLGENMFKVSFKGNGYTHAQRAEDLCLLRCAELTVNNGFRYFVIVDERSDSSISTFTTPTQSNTTGNAYVVGNNVYVNATTTTYGGNTYVIRKPSARNTILCFKEKPQGSGIVYEAQYVASSIRQTYGISEN